MITPVKGRSPKKIGSGSTAATSGNKYLMVDYGQGEKLESMKN